MSALPRGEASHSPVHALLEWIYEHSRSNILSELQLRGENEIERIAKDAGLSVSEFRRLARLGPNAPDLLERRMAALDLNPTEVSATAPQTFHDMQRVCTFCEYQRQCRRDLARDPAIPAWKDYCPNAATLTELDKLPWESRREW